MSCSTIQSFSTAFDPRALCFTKFAVCGETAVDGGSIAQEDFVGCVLLEVDDHLMGGLGKAQHGETTAEDQVWEVASFDTGRAILFSEDATSRSYLLEGSRLI